MSKLLLIPILAAAAAPLAGLASPAKPIQHDAEHYVLLHQYKDQWTAEDKEIDKKLAEIRDTSVEDIAEITTANARSLFRLNHVS